MTTENICTPTEYPVTENFNFKELIYSNTAEARGIDNTPNDTVHKNLVESCINLWQPVRDILGAPMKISSGYRGPALNKIIGGSSTSAHTHGYAIDFTCPGFGTTKEVVKKIVTEMKRLGIKWDQVILEYPKSANSWIHLGYKNRIGQQRQQVLIIDKGTGYRTLDVNKL